MNYNKMTKSQREKPKLSAPMILQAQNRTLLDLFEHTERGRERRSFDTNFNTILL
jgi:hypothetical protein